ncbi:LysR substrate-binding domain-containing protein [Actinoplanes missouriensis]|uniref:LysR substrate-binding domain-containing protein n=1 Tax=Actinoplanes missouriensis TaxID=1866 RepID=UPI0033C6FE7C
MVARRVCPANVFERYRSARSNDCRRHDAGPAPVAPAAGAGASRHADRGGAAITTLAGRHPRLRVHLTQVEPEQALPALLAREFDLVIAEEYAEQPQPRAAHAESEELLADLIRLVHPRTVRTPRNQGALALLAGHPWVMEPVGSASRAWAAAVCRTAGFEPEVRYETSDLILHLRLVEAGHAAAFLPDLIWNGRRPTVPTRPLPTTQARRRVVTTVRRGHAGHPVIVALRAALAEAA